MGQSTPTYEFERLNCRGEEQPPSILLGTALDTLESLSQGQQPKADDLNITANVMTTEMLREFPLLRMLDHESIIRGAVELHRQSPDEIRHDIAPIVTFGMRLTGHEEQADEIDAVTDNDRVRFNHKFVEYTQNAASMNPPRLRQGMLENESWCLKELNKLDRRWNDRKSAGIERRREPMMPIEVHGVFTSPTQMRVWEIE